jgi:ribonuclease HI
MSEVRIYTDGGCSGNPGPGAWAYILLAEGRRWSASAGHPATTNNRMELEAVIAALREVHSRPEWAGASLEIFTDSEYVQKGITSWIRAWEANGWRTTAKKPVKNQDLWKELRGLSSGHAIRWRWLAGHAGHLENEECDRMVRREIARRKP